MTQQIKDPVYLTADVLDEGEVKVLEERMRRFQGVGYNPDPVHVRRLFNTIRQLRGREEAAIQLALRMQTQQLAGLEGSMPVPPGWLPSKWHAGIVEWFKAELSRLAEGRAPDPTPPSVRKHTPRGKGKPRRKGLVT